MTGQAVIPSINLTSGQIVFPATQNPSGNANTLDDYEEGTFTAGLVSTAGGSITLNSTQDLMQYTKIGRLVFISGQIVVASVSSPTGAILLNGLPFTSSNIGELASRAAITVQGDGLASSLDVRGSILGNSSTIQIGKMSGGNISNMAADVTAGVSFFVSGFYLTT
jgi:enamine deaminase RidA (YjgF/YER057c/UK114 family)